MLRSGSPDTGCSAGRAAAAHEATATKVLALDFDGVVCESLDEALLISWNAHTRAPVEAFVEPGLAGVPPEVARRFIDCRPFARHLGHWLVPFAIGDVPASHAEFAARYDELPGQAIETFTAAATRYRAAVRHAYPDRWLSHHVVHRELAGVLASAYIVTARDGESVSRILDAHDVAVDDARIFGSCTDKPGALKAIAIREGVRPADVTLVDDSIENCLAAQAAGCGCLWATWGYSSPTDHARATGHGIRAIAIDALLGPPSSRLR